MIGSKSSAASQGRRMIRMPVIWAPRRYFAEANIKRPLRRLRSGESRPENADGPRC